MCVQHQHGATDCGLNAVAYATHLAHGLDSTKAKFDQGQVQEHSVRSFKLKTYIISLIEKTIS